MPSKHGLCRSSRRQRRHDLNDPGDQIGANVVALTNGHYVVASTSWDIGGATNVGIVTWANGANGFNGSPTPANSWIGAASSDQIGSAGVLPLSNGNCVILSKFWPNGRAVIGWPGFNVPELNDVGALIHLGGAVPTTGTMPSTASFVGTSASKNLGAPAPKVYSDDMLALKVPNWDIGIAPLNAGGVCLLDGRNIVGQVNTRMCVLGTLANLGSSMVADYSVSRKQMVVGVPSENKVVILDNTLFSNGFE